MCRIMSSAASPTSCSAPGKTDHVGGACGATRGAPAAPPPLDRRSRRSIFRPSRVTMGARRGVPRFARKRLPVDTSFRPLSTKWGCPSGAPS